MEFHRLTSAQDTFFDEAFALYEISFPAHEQRKRDKQEALMTNPLYCFDVILEDGDFCGILLYWMLSGYAYIEHFAIQSDVRGKALGTRSLGTFCQNHPLVILEIDPPVDEISIRREGFYQKLGFHTNAYPHAHPAYQPQLPPHDLVVMSYPRGLTQGEYQLFACELRDTVMKDAQ